jgi:23S rRNA (guanine2445-N2)-methyltransferase / 23S rRNA (guanine2069-N7)-methyltransferase
MAATHTFIATTTSGAEEALVRELRAIGIHRTKLGRGHVRFTGPPRDGYLACMWSRVASRVFQIIAQFEARDADALYQGLLDTDWREHVRSKGTLWIDFVGRSRHIRDERFGAQRSKDAICDQLRTMTGNRPSVSQQEPDLRLRVHLRDGLVTVSVDLSGEPLHMRSALRFTGPAPLRETLAAAVLWHADWPKRAARGEPLHDPMCGSGTFLLEAAGMALDVAPGLSRKVWGFDRWKSHSPKVWTLVREEALQKKETGKERSLQIFGADADKRAVSAARKNLAAAGCGGLAQIEHQTLAQAMSLTEKPGLLVVNPPYGQRLLSETEAVALHRTLGDTLRHRFLGWTAAVLTEHTLVGSVGLKTSRRIPIRNGPLDCRLAVYEISSTAPHSNAEPKQESLT